MASVESRVFQRVNYRAEVRCEVQDDGRTVIAESENLSDGGALLSSNEELAVGLNVRLTMRLLAEEPTTVAAVVRWSKSAEGGRWMIGAEFCDDEPGRDAVRDLIETLAPTDWSGGGEESLPRRIAVAFVPIVRRMARSMSRTVPVHVDDLIGAGFLGLVEAYRQYRPDLNPSFDAYARLRIRGRMMDEARSVDSLSRRQRSVGKLLARARSEYVARNGREPEPKQLASLVGLTQDDVEASRLAVANQRPTDDSALEFIGDAMASPEAQSIRGEGVEQVKLALSALPERLRKILEMYYGEEMTLRSIALVVGVSEARVSQLHSEAIRHLRERVGQSG